MSWSEMGDWVKIRVTDVFFGVYICHGGGGGA